MMGRNHNNSKKFHTKNKRVGIFLKFSHFFQCFPYTCRHFYTSVQPPLSYHSYFKLFEWGGGVGEGEIPGVVLFCHARSFGALQAPHFQPLRGAGALYTMGPLGPRCCAVHNGALRAPITRGTAHSRQKKCFFGQLTKKSNIFFWLPPFATFCRPK